jgi:hypothetical protein
VGGESIEIIEHVSADPPRASLVTVLVMLLGDGFGSCLFFWFDWADVVFVMEYWMKERLLLHFRVRADKIKVLGIKDRHFYGEPELVKTIAERLKRHGINAEHVVDKFKPVREDDIWGLITAGARL